MVPVALIGVGLSKKIGPLQRCSSVELSTLRSAAGAVRPTSAA